MQATFCTCTYYTVCGRYADCLKQNNITLLISLDMFNLNQLILMMIYLRYGIKVLSCFAWSVELYYVYAYSDIKVDHYQTVADLEIHFYFVDR